MMGTIVRCTYWIVLNRPVGSSLVEETRQGAMNFIPRFLTCFNKTFSLRFSYHARYSLSCKVGDSVEQDQS